MLSGMWIFAPTTGFLSVVLARVGPDDPTPDPDYFNVRARRREHLEMLRRSCPALASIQITESSSGHDYRYRMVPCPKAAFADAIRELILATDYTNHKSACAAAPGLDGEFQRVLHDVWAATRRLT